VTARRAIIVAVCSALVDAVGRWARSTRARRCAKALFAVILLNALAFAGWRCVRVWVHAPMSALDDLGTQPSALPAE